ncbi:MAG: hypothetical protein ACYS1A_09465 [Planctomycetota bacterium]|jgi:hypothetical protein
MKLRIAVALAVGVLLLGILAWPLAQPTEQAGIVSLSAISLDGVIALVVLALLAGFLAYFLSWPYGLQIGILAVPAGLTIWAVRTGDITGIIQLNPTSLSYRQELFASLKWEPIFWLIIVATGFIGVLLAHIISSKKARPAPGVEKPSSKPESWLFALAPVATFLMFSLALASDEIMERAKLERAESDKPKEKPNSRLYMYINTAVALVGSGLIAQVFIIAFAQDIKIFDNKLGSVVAQPAVAQIAFAVLLSFAIAAFLVKKFLDASYIWPIIASALTTAFALSIYGSQNILNHLVQNQPANFFSIAIIAILPIQMVAFGTLGSIIGYWMAVRYKYWRKHESK